MDKRLELTEAQKRAFLNFESSFREFRKSGVGLVLDSFSDCVLVYNKKNVSELLQEGDVEENDLVVPISEMEYFPLCCDNEGMCAFTDNDEIVFRMKS